LFKPLAQFKLENQSTLSHLEGGKITSPILMIF
jgi:hypothetical protein